MYDKSRYPQIVKWLEENINQSDAMPFYEYFKENYDYIALIVYEFMLNLAKAKKLPGYSAEKILEIFSAYTKSGDYYNPHLYQWYQYFDAQNLLTYDDFIQELEYLLNIGAYEILEKEIDQHGFRYATGIKTQTLDNFHHMLFNPAAMDSTEKTDILKDIMLRSWIQQKRYEYIFTTFNQTTEPVIFPYLIRSAVYLKKSCSDWWLNPPPHRPGILLWSYTQAMMDYDIHDKRQIMNYLLKQRTAFVGYQQTAADWYLARLHTESEIEKFTPVFARWLMNQGQKPREQAKLLLIEWQKNTQKKFEVLETNFQVLEILRYVDPENAVTYERLREELTLFQKEALLTLQQEKVTD